MSKLINLGMSKEQFLHRVVEREMLLVRRAFSPTLVCWDDLNRALHCVEAGSPSIRLHKGGVVSEQNYIEHSTVVGVPVRRINQQVLYAYMRAGATLVLNRLDDKFEVIRQLCVEVARLTETQTIANGYVAFSGEGSFGNHWDTHDVMAVQLIGRKRWQLFKPTFELPLSGQTSKNHKQDCSGDPVFDGVLEAGDLLYVPRGWWHNATPIGETFHVAIGAHAGTVMDYVQWLCQTSLREHVELRRSVRPHQNITDLVRDAAAVVAQSLVDPERQAMYLRALEDATATTFSPFTIQAGDLSHCASMDKQKEIAK